MVHTFLTDSRKFYPTKYTTYTVSTVWWVILEGVNLANLAIFSLFAKIESAIFIHCAYAQ